MLATRAAQTSGIGSTMPSSPSVHSQHSTWFHMSRRRQTLLVLSAAVGALLAAAVAAPLHHDVSRSCVQLTRILVTRATPTVFFGRYPVEVDAKNETEPSNLMFVASVDRWHMAFKRLQRDVRAASRGGAWARTDGLSAAILACSIVVLVVPQKGSHNYFLSPDTFLNPHTRLTTCRLPRSGIPAVA